MPALRQALRAAAQADWAFRAAGDGLQWTEHTENQSVTVIRQRPTEKHTKDNCIDHCAMNKSCSCCACAQLKHAACANWKCRCAVRLASVPSQCRGLSRVSSQCLPSFQNAKRAHYMHQQASLASRSPNSCSHCARARGALNVSQPSQLRLHNCAETRFRCISGLGGGGGKFCGSAALGRYPSIALKGSCMGLAFIRPG